MKIPHLRGGELQDAGSQMSILQSRLLAYTGGNWPELAFLSGARFAFVMSVSAPQERDFIEHVLLEPFQPEINDRSDKERDHLRENKPADDGRHDCWKQDRDWVHIAFIKNSEDHVHDENGGNQKQRQRLEKLSEHKRFALEGRLNAGILSMHLRERVFDEFGRVADRDA